MQTWVPLVTNSHPNNHSHPKFSNNNLPKECYSRLPSSSPLNHNNSPNHPSSKLFQSEQLQINRLKSKRKDPNGKMWSHPQPASLN